MQVYEVGECKEFGVTSYYAPNAEANILSFGKLRECASVTYDDVGDAFRITPPSGVT
jgi:hypothetical protein